MFCGAKKNLTEKLLTLNFKVMRVYSIEYNYVISNGYYQGNFYFVTSDPIETNFDNILNKICNIENLKIKDTKENYFDFTVIPLVTLK